VEAGAAPGTSPAQVQQRADQAAALVEKASGLSAEKRRALLDKILEEELAVLAKLVDGRGLSDHLEDKYLRALTLAFSALPAAQKR
jgi:hypothetical protein